MQIKTWISAFRLRTLPLATAAVLMGITLADEFYSPDWELTFWCWFTAVCLQVLSNLANDYGDFQKGTDNENRIGNTRALQSGNITPTAMLRMIVVFVLLSLFSGINLLWKATEGEINYQFVAFLIVGLAAIAAAIKYTVGKKAYGYTGFGDVFVFFFFGPVAVIGTFLLNSHFRFSLEKNWSIFLPAIAIGLLCAGVLNVNNIRDIENDKNSGKHTIPVIIGEQAAKKYHAALILLAIILIIVYIFARFQMPHLLLLIPTFVLIFHLKKVFLTSPSPSYNLFLKQLSLTTLLLAFLFYVSLQIIKLWGFGYFIG